MPLLLTCPHGHEWESSASTALGGGSTPAACPVCGAIAIDQETRAVEAWPELRGELPPLSQPISRPAYSTAAWSRRTPVWPTIAGYEILGELGHGGMGVVYKARQENLSRVVALKMLLPDSGSGPAALVRLRHEAGIVAALRHVNFVHIYDISEQGGLPFFVMEFVEGGSLSELLAKRPLPPGQAAELLETLARAMHCAHQGGIIHRDLKPANILLMADGTPKIADFGLAKNLDGPSDRTRAGAIKGTPSYMSPEQALGRSGDVGPGTDIYALGAILYEMLTARPPFKADSVLGTLNQVVHEPPVPPRELLPDTPQELEQICLRCLEKQPARRYASADDLAEDLRRFRLGYPRQKVKGPARASRRNVVLGVGLAALLTAGLAIAWGVLGGRKADTRPEQEPVPPGIAGPVSLPAPVVEVAPAPREIPMLRAEPVVVPWRAGKLLCVALAPDGQTIALGGESDTVELWDTKTGERLGTLPKHPGHVFALAFSPEGQMLAVGASKEIWLWDVEARKRRGILEGHSGKVQWVGFISEGKSLASLSPGALKLWRVDTKEQTGGLDGLAGRLELTPDGKYLAETNTDNAVFAPYRILNVWEVAKGEKFQPVKRYLEPLTFSPDGRILAGGIREREKDTIQWKVLVFGVTGLSPRGSQDRHRERVHSVAISPDGRTLASGSEDKRAILWDMTAKNDRPFLEGHTGPVLVRFSPSGRILATASTADSFVKLWDVASGEEQVALQGHTMGVTDLQFSPNGRSLAVRCQDHSVKVWNIFGVSTVGK